MYRAELSHAESGGRSALPRDFGALAGPLTEPPPGPYRVQYRPLGTGRGSVVRTMLVVLANVGVELAFVLWLLAPAHHPELGVDPVVDAANVFVLATVVVIEGLRLVNVFSLSLASLLARDPIPVHPDPSMSVAFLTTIVPGKEPVEMVRATLRAARRIRYRGRLDMWLLDEGDDDDVRLMCAREWVQALGGAHFIVDSSRNGNGRPDGDTINGGSAFCNPPGRAVGVDPTTEVGDPIVDAYLWIKRVGESDGACRPGEPVAGQWWPEYALGLVGSRDPADAVSRRRTARR